MQNMRDNSCMEYRDLILDYFSDNLTEIQEKRLMLHIESCPECKNEFDSIKQIIGAAADIPEVEVPDELKIALSEKIAETVENMKKRRKIYKFAMSTALPVAACAALAIGVFSGGVYDKLTNADNMVVIENTETATPQIKTEETDTNAVVNQPEISQSAPAKNTESGSKPEKVITKDGPTVQEADANVASAESAEDDAVAMSGGGGSARAISDAEEEHTPKAASMFAMRDSSAVYEQAEETDADEKRDIPVSCVIITENPEQFAAGFGIINVSGDEITFEISADEWTAFVNYNRECGTKLEAEFSGEKTDVIFVTVKSE